MCASCRGLSLLFPHIRGYLAIGSHVDDLCGQQGLYGLKKLLRLDERHVGLGVTDMGGTAIISDAPQVGSCTEDSAHAHR